tara:strand:+ start:235 stop:810 length:576 start_codon:yes stop_codon:yes gene_type:complete
MAAAATAGKLGAQIMAGQKLGKFFDIISGTAGKLATQATQAGVGKVADTFYKGVAQENLPMVLRSSATSMLPRAAGAAAQIGTYALGSYGLDKGLDQVFDQQSQHTQPMPSGVGNRDMANFLYSQQLQNQKFMHDMALVQARAESRIPGAQYGGSLLDQARAEKEITDAGEITNREVQGIGRMIYGTGLRA